MTQIWFITGAGRGLGAEIARSALAEGDLVAATGRSRAALTHSFGRELERLLLLELDVTNPEAAQAAAEAAIARFGEVGILVNNAGYGHLGLFEETTLEDAQAQFATNIFGVFNVTWAILPHMRERRKGRVLNISSIAGVCGGQGSSLYSTSKHAVEGFSESLALEVAPFGIKVTIIEPGFFRTEFLSSKSGRHGGKAIADYAGISERLGKLLAEQNGRQVGDPAKLGTAICRLASTPEPPLRFVAGRDAVEVVQTKIQRLQTDLDTWHHLSVSTDFGTA